MPPALAPRQRIQRLCMELHRIDRWSLPHPVQLRNLGVYEAIEGVAQQVAPMQEVLHEARQPHAGLLRVGDCFIDILVNMVNRPVGASLADTAHQMEGFARTFGAYWLYRARSGALIEPTAGLEQLLTRSDLDSALPVHLLVPPYAAQYLRYGPVARQVLAYVDPELGTIAPEGLYCFMTREPDGSRRLCFQWHLVRDDGRDCGLQTLEAPESNPEQPMVEWLASLPERGSHVIPPLPRQEALGRWVMYAAKVFLYLALKDARQLNETSFSDLATRLQRIGLKKAGKLERRMARAYDRILVGPEALPDHLSGDGRSVSPHWRRGHFRHQAHGPKQALRKLIFVAPTLIAAEALTGPAPNPKVYVPTA